MSDFGRPPPDSENMTSLKVDNLSYRTKPEELKKEFERFGEVGDIYIPKDRVTKESRGFAFVRFYDRRDAENAMEKMDGEIFDERELRVQKAKYGRPSRPPANRGRYGGDRSNSRYDGGGRGNYDSGGRGNNYDRGSGYSGSNRRSRSPRSRSPPRRRGRSFSRSPKRKSPSKSRSKSPRRSSPPPRERSRSRSRSPPARGRWPEQDD